MFKRIKKILLYLLIFNISIIYLTINSTIYFPYILLSLISISFLFLVTISFKIKANKKIQTIQQTALILLTVIYSCSFYLFNSYDILFSTIIITLGIVSWINLIKKIISFIRLNPSFIYNETLYSRYEYKLLLNRYGLLSTINFFSLPLLSIMLISDYYLDWNSKFIILKISPFVVLCIIILLLTKKMKKIISSYKKNSSSIVYDEINKYQPDFILYFSGNSQSTYQVNSWIPLLSVMKFKFVIFLREHHHYCNLENSEYPIVFLKNTIDIERISSISSIKAALYTTNVGKNIHLIRDIRIKHIFIGHGDSDKSGSANNLMKLYDHMFVAGDAHIDRMNKNNITTPENYFYKIGRPQLELLPIKKNNSKEKINLLYAPTWEGYYENSCYSSLNQINEELEQYIKKNQSNINFIFRPHPHTGVIDKKYNKIKNKLINLTNYKYDDLYDCFQFADILIADISGILSDFIYLNKPIILYHPEIIDNIKAECPISSCCYIIDKNSNISDLIKKIQDNDYLLEERIKMKNYIMGDDSLSYIEKFTNALKSVNP